MAKTPATGPVPTRYAAALIDMAEKANVIPNIEKDFTELGAMLAGSKDLMSLVRNPLFNRAQQGATIAALAQKAGFSDLTTRFLGVLVQNRRVSVLPAVVLAVKAELNRRRGGVEARVQSAYVLSDAQTKALQKSLSDAMGSNVSLNVEVDKDILGGMIVTVGSRMIDDSVRGKLERLKRTLSGSKAA